ncbi:MAG: hypothetical protein PF693_05625 [Spirochaetia bacterium]|jgi:hypothetical protein|nr:hypothetical protein [Spirochaetia bacterium]
MLKRNFILMIFLFIGLYLYSWEAGLFSSSFVNVPEGWYVLENREDKVTFADPADSAYFQIKRYPGDSFRSVLDLYKYVSRELGSTGEGELFLFDSKESYFSSISFESSGFSYMGYLVCIEGESEDIVLLSFSDSDNYNIYHDFIISAIDSYSMNESGLKNPGPVSQYYYPWPGRDKTINYLTMNGQKIPVSFDINEIDTAKVLIEREARILVQYTNSNLSDLAWARYYKLIYRDNINRLRRVARIAASEIADDFESLSPLEKSSKLLQWIQGFEYLRTGTLSDFMGPIDTVFEAAGDCDSRSLLYVMLLEYNGIDSILMVSSEYSHSLTGVAVEGKGAHYYYEGSEYLIAETTDNVSIGLIDQDMADPSKWMGIKF